MSEELLRLEKAIIEQIRTIYDPEIPVNIYELGLIYEIDIKADYQVDIKMTLTSPNCPAAESLPPEVESKVGAVAGVKEAHVIIVWEPPWSPDLMTEAAKLELGML
jgi:FeS assembly SUF system protein